MKNIRIFYLKIFIILMVKFSIYLNRRIFVMMHTFCDKAFIIRMNLFFVDFIDVLTLLLQNTTCPVLVNSVDPDQLAFEICTVCH